MPVLKTYTIDTVEILKEIRKKVLEKQEQVQYKTYTEEDIILIRTTNTFPNNKIVASPNQYCFLKENSNFLYDALSKQINSNMTEKLYTLIPIYRSTVHLTENGLVLSHSYGNFQYKNFIILEKLNDFKEKYKIRNLAGQDTFIKDSFTLSDNAIIIIRQENFEKLLQEFPELIKFNIILYNGMNEEYKLKFMQKNQDDLNEFYLNDERAIVEQVILDLGLTPELIGQHYITESVSSKNIEKFNKELAEKLNITYNEKHIYSKDYASDLDKSFELLKIFDYELLNFIIKIHQLNEQDFEKPNYTSANTLLYLLGIDELIKDIESFNDTIKKLKCDNLLPKTEDIFTNMPNIYEAYVILNNTKKKKLIHLINFFF